MTAALGFSEEMYERMPSRSVNANRSHLILFTGGFPFGKNGLDVFIGGKVAGVRFLNALLDGLDLPALFLKIRPDSLGDQK